MLTRRQVLELAAAAWLTAVLGRVATARAAGVDAVAPGYLRRASWVPLTGTAVGVAGVTLLLAEVADLPHLAGRDDAFGLQLTGAAGALPGGIHPFRHAALGSFDLFLSPVDTVSGGVQRYEVVVDRSIGVPDSVPQAPSAASTIVPTAGPATPVPALAALLPGTAAPVLVPAVHAPPHPRPRKRTHLRRRARHSHKLASVRLRAKRNRLRHSQAKIAS
jgi:hypothetical protein